MFFINVIVTLKDGHSIDKKYHGDVDLFPVVGGVPSCDCGLFFSIKRIRLAVSVGI